MSLIIPLRELSEPIRKVDDSADGILNNNNFQASSDTIPKSTEMFLICNLGTADYPYPSSAVAVDIVSTSANDTLLGSGARKVTVIGLDGNRDQLVEEVDMAGTTAVTLTNAFFRINKLFLTDSDTRGINDGDITLSTTVGADLLAFMEAEVGQSFDGVFSTPAGITTSFFLIDVTAGKGDSGAIAFFRSTEDGPFVQRTADIHFYQNNFSRDFVGPIEVPPESDIQLKARVDNDNTQLTVTAQLVTKG